ncbi:hypothetical protein XarbCFBP7610_16370 [Xanthomonas arboricola]|nr:hypothetical protein XarbCFBP7610_16370 [Xanthomonas arboricola]
MTVGRRGELARGFSRLRGIQALCAGAVGWSVCGLSIGAARRDHSIEPRPLVDDGTIRIGESSEKRSTSTSIT